MKLFVVLGLLACAFAARDQWDSEETREIRTKAFLANKEYRFVWDGQVNSGLPTSSSQHASTRVQAHVSVIPENDRSMLLKISKVRVGSAHAEVRNLDAVLPFEDFEKTELTREQESALLLPIRFRYTNGVVSEMEFDREDHTWSENIKRAIVNMLQVNMKKNEGRKLERSEENNEFFTVQERTIEGECDVAYTVTKNGREELSVSKAINFDKCVDRKDSRYNYRFGERCEGWCEEDKISQEDRTIESTTVLNYKLAGSVDKFLVREVESKSQYVLRALKEQQKLIATYVNSKLVLVDVIEKETRIESPKSEKKSNLLYSNEWDVAMEKYLTEGDEQFLTMAPEYYRTNVVEKIVKLVKLLVKKMSSESGVEIESTVAFEKLVKHLRFISKEELHTLHREICTSDKYEEIIMEKMVNIFNDALALAGSKLTIEHLTEKITSGKITPIKSAQLLNAIANARVASEKTVELIVNMCKNDIVESNPILKQTCWLTAGSLMNGVCGATEDKYATLKKDICPRTLNEKFVKILSHLYEKSTTRYEKILALKTAANAGLELSVRMLETIIHDRAEEKTIRLQAIDALRQLNTVMPRKIQSILMPVYKSRVEQPELRMNALFHIMNTFPNRVTIEQIASQINNERSQQVRMFTYTTLTNYAKSKNPCEKRMAEDIQVALRIARVQPTKVMSSRFARLPVFTQDYTTGMTFDFATLFTNESFVPKEMMASIDSLFGGQFDKKLAQVGFYQQNIDKIIMKILKKLENTNEIEEVIVRGKRSTSFRPSEILRNLFNKLSIKSRHVESEQDPHALLYIRYKNLDYAFLPIEEETIPEVIKSVVRNGKIQLAEIERILTQGYKFRLNGATFVYEASRKIATSIGMPIVISSKMPTVGSFEGHVKFDFEPKNGNKFEGLRMHIAGQPSMSSTHITKMELQMPFANHGVKLVHSLQMNLPLDMTVAANWEKTLEISTVVKTPEQKIRLFNFHSHPITFTTEEKTVRVEELENMYTVERSYGQKTLGLEIEALGSVHRHFFTTMKPVFWGINKLEFNIKPTKETPREYLFKVDIEAFKPATMEKPELENFFEDKTSNTFFEVEKKENEDDYETERRSIFNRYVKSLRMEKVFKHRIVFRMEAVESRVERKAHFEIRALCDNKVRYCKMNVEARRSALNEESRDWELKSTIQTLYPEMPETLEKLVEQIHREFHAVVETMWGSEEKNTMTFRIQGEQNRDQKMWMHKIEKKMDMLRNYELLNEAAQLNQYKIVVDHKLTTYTRKNLEKFYALFKGYNWLNAEVSRAEKDDHRVFLMLTVEPETRRYMNIVLESPIERLVIEDIYLPIRLGSQRIVSEGSLENWSDVARKVTEERKAMCEVKSTKVNTFDEVVYKAPITTCYSVLVKDCKEEPKFAVLMKKVEKRGEEKKLKVINMENVYELEKVEEKIVVKVNGKIVRNEKDLENYGIERLGAELYRIELEDLTVRFDGYSVQIRLSELYKNQQCGMCGHFDGERDNEFRRNDNVETEDIEEFHRGYLTKDSECEIEESRLSDKSNYRKYDSEEMTEEMETEEEIIEPVLKTKVLEHSHRVCFSMKPIPECPRRSEMSESRKIEVEFGCFSRSNTEVRRMLRLLRKENLSIQDEESTVVKNISVPKACLAL